MKIYKENNGKNNDGWWHFYNNTYEFNLYIYFGDVSVFNKQLGLNENKTLGKTYTIDENEKIVMWFPNKRPAPETVAHEALHAVNSVFGWKNIAYDIHNDECATYLLGWFVKAVNTCK